MISNQISEYINILFANTELVPFFLSMLPITELRAAIPWAILIQKIPWYEAVFYSILGNFLIIIPILYFLEPITKQLRNFQLMLKSYWNLLKGALLRQGYLTPCF